MKPPLPQPASAHVVVVGAGGIGCPAAWALAEAGVGRLTIVDPDEVEPSNLPRQVLYVPGDVGHPKALVAAGRLARYGSRVEGAHARLDDTTEDRLLADADLVVDATDGARTKDWINALAVRRRLPLIHAAGLRSEARLLDVPAGGAPCLACLFGRLEEEQGTCADLGVWGGVVGAIGFLAAQRALERLRSPGPPSGGYDVLDLESGRAFTLAAAANPACPVCGAAAPKTSEPFPAAAGACAAAPGAPDVEDAAGYLDLFDEVCPLNLLRARRAVEEAKPGDLLTIRLGPEGAASVPDGLRALGHAVAAERRDGAALVLQVRRGGRAEEVEPLDRDLLLRFARQIVLPEVGEAGQRRLLGGAARVFGAGPTAETAATYLEAAGVARVSREATDETAACRVEVERAQGEGVRVVHPVHGDGSPARAVARAVGALLADAACRALVLDRVPSPAFGLAPDGRIIPSSTVAP